MATRIISESATPAQILSSYQLPDGTPDIQKRRAALHELVTQLTFSDRRFVEDLIRSSAVMEQDMMIKFPIEILLLIIDHLPDPADILAFRLVCKRWNTIWTGDQVMRASLSAQFPDTIDRNTLKDDGMAVSLSTQRSGDGTAQLYRQTCRKFTRRQNGHYDSTLAGLWRFPYDQNFELDAVVPPRELMPLEVPRIESEEVRPEADQVKYSHGRLAWRYKHHLIVDDLQTLKRAIYDIPARYKLTGPPPSIEAIGDRLLVASVGRTILVWDLPTRQMHAVTVPAQPLHCHVGGNTLGIITVTSSILIYEFGHSLKELDIPEELAKSFGKAGKKRKGHMGIILDPSQVKNGIVYLVSAHKPKSEEGMIYMIASFKDHKFVCKWQKPSFVQGGAWCSLRCTRANNSGLYTLLLESSEMFTPCANFSNEHQFAEYYNHTYELLFDTKKQKFYENHYHVPFVDDVFVGLMDISDKYKTWGGRMIVSLEHGEDMTTFSECEHNLHATSLVGSLPGCEIRNDSRPFYRVGDPLRPDPDDIKQSRHPLLCCWDPCPDLELEFLLEPWRERLCQRFDADDNFVVTFGGLGYASWRFDNAYMEPVKRSENDLRASYGLPREDLDFFGDDMDDDGWEDEDEMADEDGMDAFDGDLTMDDADTELSGSIDSDDDSHSEEEDEEEMDNGMENTAPAGNNSMNDIETSFAWHP